MRRLEIYLNDLPVGTLERRGDAWNFRFLSSYVELPKRPVLGRMFEADLGRAYSSQWLLPPFFSNLLPEGALHQFLLAQFGHEARRDEVLLAKLGDDLPGAVRVRWATEHDAADSCGFDLPAQSELEVSQRQGSRFRFSLAGVQLKFTAERSAERWTLPASGRGEKWILKLPDREHAGLPALELSMLHWARTARLAVPDHELVEASAIDDLPVVWDYDETSALAVKRYDRLATGGRIHQEDFAQVLGQFPQAKYDFGNYETLARIYRRLCSPAEFREVVSRLVFMILSGNGDAHLKNWSLYYPDPEIASLPPAYDLISTVVYPAYREFALKFVGTKHFEEVDLGRFRRLAQRIGHDAAEMAAWVEEDATRIREAWVAVRQDVPMLPEHRVALEAHLGRMSL